MAMNYPRVWIAPDEVPAASDPLLQHMLDTYASEINKVATIWMDFGPEDLAFRPHAKSYTVAEVFRHQLLSERRFFAEFLSSPEPAAGDVLPVEITAESCRARLVELSLPRLRHLAPQPRNWWVEKVRFFDVERERIWIFWRRVLHTAHHRTQLSLYQRLLGRAVLPVYGPTADVQWVGADPTVTVESTGRG